MGVPSLHCFIQNTIVKQASFHYRGEIASGFYGESHKLLSHANKGTKPILLLEGLACQTNASLSSPSMYEIQPCTIQHSFNPNVIKEDLIHISLIETKGDWDFRISDLAINRDETDI